MKNSKMVHLTMIKGFAALCICFSFLVVFTSHVRAGEEWKAEFEDICSKVDASQALTVKEMEELIQRADKLLPVIEKSDDPSKKVYLKRLKNCRAMYQFMIDTKKD